MPEVYGNYIPMPSVLSENQDYLPYGHDALSMSDRSTYSPYSGSTNSQGTSVPSPMSTSLSPLHGTEYLTLSNVVVTGEPHITILEQPVEKFRFRYKSEMIGTHGSLVGANTSSSRRKQAPTVQLHNYAEKAIIRCTLVTSDETQRIPHAHRLVRREGNTDRDDPHHITVSTETGHIAAFHGMGIIHTAKKNVRDELIRKMRMEALERNRRKNINATLNTREEAQIKDDAEFYQKCVNLNSVALSFQAFILDANDVMTPLTEPVYSQPINNLKSALTGELKICRIDKTSSSCEGGEEVFIFVEKVGKKNIKIKFFETDDEDREIWSALGRFTELDVHHQYAIVFRTPPYKDLNITSSREVFIQLERPSDGDTSDPIKFTYKPSGKILGRKRQRMSYSGSAELSQIFSNYNDAVMSEVPHIMPNESQDLSKELTRMLSEGCPSSEYKDFLSQIDVEKYMFLANTEENMLTSDGTSQKESEDDAMFAKNVVLEAIKCLKEDRENAKERLQKLFKDRSTYGDSPLHSALRYGQRDIAKYILLIISTDKDCKALVNGQNSSGKTPLHCAVLQNESEITRALLWLGADPNKFDDHGFSPLHAAVRIPNAGACVDALLSQKITDIEAHNDAGWTALQLAAEAGSYHAVRSLVKAGANVNNTDMSYGRTALHIAVEGGHKSIVEFLLKETKIDVNKRNFSGNTALHSAVVYTGTRAKELCSLLIKHGADPHIQNHSRDSDDADQLKTQSDDIKEEIDSEEETMKENAGESSFDLASNKPDILQLLTNQTDEHQSEMYSISTKEEDIDDAESAENRLNAEQQQKLSTILNKTSGWKKLAKHLNFEFLLETLQHSTENPSLLFLHYIDIQSSVSLSDMETGLRKIGEKEAADYVAEILSVRKQISSKS